MQVTIGKDGLDKTQQADFPETIREPHLLRGSEVGGELCDGESRIGFVAHEGDVEDDDDDNSRISVSDLHINQYQDGEAWLHDYCSVAVYFCKKCLRATAHWNQG